MLNFAMGFVVGAVVTYAYGTQVWQWIKTKVGKQ